MTLLNQEENAWPVQVFRYTTAKGWESVENVSDKDAVTAVPRKGAIDIRKFRVRIKLCNGENTNVGYATRRLDRIYLPSRSGTSTAGALVLKFSDKSECITFFDRLLLLNKPTDSNNNMNTNDENALPLSDQNGRKKRARAEQALDLDEPQLKRRKTDIFSYIIRLLHDDSFLKFVNDIEETLLSSEDGASILAAMKHGSPATRVGALKEAATSIAVTTTTNDKTNWTFNMKFIYIDTLHFLH